jgi:hypothetical protein
MFEATQDFFLISFYNGIIVGVVSLFTQALNEVTKTFFYQVISKL